MKDGYDTILDRSIVIFRNKFVLSDSNVIHMNTKVILDSIQISWKLLIKLYFYDSVAIRVIDPTTYILTLIYYVRIHIWKWFYQAVLYGGVDAIHESNFIHICNITPEIDILIYISGFRWYFNSIISPWIVDQPSGFSFQCTHIRPVTVFRYIDIFLCNVTVLNLFLM